VAEASGAGGENEPNSGFPKVIKQYEEKGHACFDDPAYYKSIVGDGSDICKRVHMIFQKYITSKDPKDKTVFRQQLSTVYWDLFANVAKSAAAALPKPKEYLLRFGMLHPGLLQPDIKALFSKVVEANALEQPVYYLDEWFGMIGRGELRPSTTDEAPAARGDTPARFIELLERANGKLDGLKGLLRGKEVERKTMEEKLRQDCVIILTDRQPAQFSEVRVPMDEGQKLRVNSLQETAKIIVKAEREMEVLLRDYDAAREDIEAINAKIKEAGGRPANSDTIAIETEAGTVRQLAKMTVGRQGNAFPILSGEFFSSTPKSVGIRENVISILSWIESVDAEAFIRVYKNRPNRVVPYVILVPTYGDKGACWEPVDRSNKATGRGRITVPMYPRNLTIAVLTAVADYRWQAAKEANSFYWMEEGLTGNYYQWFQAQKLKGDVRVYFIQDYILWMTKESEGVQKVDKEVRSTFWRYMPFAQPVKEKLKDRSMIYQELYQRDLNRAKSEM
jgi:hypothetical protein